MHELSLTLLHLQLRMATAVSLDNCEDYEHLASVYVELLMERHVDKLREFFDSLLQPSPSPSLMIPKVHVHVLSLAFSHCSEYRVCSHVSFWEVFYMSWPVYQTQGDWLKNTWNY